MSELETAVLEVKRRLGVESAPANEIARHLPEHLRQPFWERAIDYYVADQTALLDAAESTGLIAAAERRGYDRAVANLRDDSAVELVAQFARHHNPDTQAKCPTCKSWARGVLGALAKLLEATKETDR